MLYKEVYKHRTSMEKLFPLKLQMIKIIVIHKMPQAL